MISEHTREDAVTVCTMVASSGASGLGHACACLRLGLDRQSGAGALARAACFEVAATAPWLDFESSWAEAASLIASGEWDPWGSAAERRTTLTAAGQYARGRFSVVGENAPVPAGVQATREDNAARIERTP